MITKFELLVFIYFFPFVNIFTNAIIKTPMFSVSPSLKNIKIRNEFIKRISITKQKLTAILFWSIFFWCIRYIHAYVGHTVPIVDLKLHRAELLWHMVIKSIDNKDQPPCRYHLMTSDGPNFDAPLPF